MPPLPFLWKFKPTLAPEARLASESAAPAAINVPRRMLCIPPNSKSRVPFLFIITSRVEYFGGDMVIWAAVPEDLKIRLQCICKQGHGLSCTLSPKIKQAQNCFFM